MEFARRGDAVAVIARGKSGLKRTAAALGERGVPSLTLSIDVAEWSELRAGVQQIEDELGPIDVWVNNAMVSVFSPFSEMAVEEFRRVTDVDYLGFVHGTKAALEVMLPRDRGVIVQVGSALGFRSIPLQSAYCGAKHAIAGFSESVLTELMHARSGVKLTVVNMPAMNTPQFDWVRSRLERRAQPVPPIYQPEVGARAVVYAADHPNRHRYYVGAPTSLTLVAQKIAPVLLDHYLARTGFGSQQTNEQEDRHRPDNLLVPLDSDHQSHGRFDDRSHRHSLQLWLSLHRAPMTGVLALGAVALGALARKGAARELAEKARRDVLHARRAS